MSWHFSRALVEEYLADGCSAGERFVPWNLTPFAPDDLCSARMKATCHRSPYGTMYVPLMDGHGVALLTWFRAGFRARILAKQRLYEKGWKVHEADFGTKQLVLLTKYDPYMHCWKILRDSLTMGWIKFSGTWPKWGTMQNGAWWPRETLVLRTSESVFGYWPTPNLPNGGRSTKHVTDWRGPRTAFHNGKKVQVGLEHFGKRTPLLEEWMLGWPAAWTDLRPLATGKFRQWLQRHGVYSTRG